MKYLFLDNFRGFTNTYIPIEEVNFLVGENSTGKTSMLGILKLISLPEFWMNNIFDTRDVNFGHFKDIVSINSSDRSYFSIGFIQDNISRKGDKDLTTHAFLMTFIEDEGMPRPSMYIYCYGTREMRIRIEKGAVKYKHKDIQLQSDAENFIKKVYKVWVKAGRSDNNGYKTLPPDYASITKAPLFVIASVVEDLVYEKNTDHLTQVFRMPALLDEIAWLAPIRTKPKRTYDEYKKEFSPEGDHTPYLIKRILGKKSKAKEFKKFLEQIGRESGLFETVDIKKYGSGATAPFELDVMLNKKALNISSVGYGVSQSLPVIVELLARPKGAWYAIQQPEVHLHPKAQAALGDVFFKLAMHEGKRFFVETHSDYTIDRYCLNYKKKGLKKKPKAQILYFERAANGNHIHQLEIDENGELPSRQPKGYRKFFIKEDMKLLGL